MCKPTSSQNDQFFITEDVNQFAPSSGFPGGPSRVIQEEHSQESEMDDGPNEMHQNLEGLEDLKIQDEDLDEGDMDMNMAEDENFDFGRAKMDYFKQRAREILLGQSFAGPASASDLYGLQADGTFSQVQGIDYDRNSVVPLGGCYKNLKNLLRKPTVVHNTGSEHKPGYLKMTFSMCRNAVNGERFLEISKLKESTMMNKIL